MLQVSNNEIVFSYRESATLISTINIKNSSPIQYLTFKMKTTAPQLFQVSPSQGILNPGQSKAVNFRTIRTLSKEQARDISTRQKFLIESVPFKDNKKAQIKTLISKLRTQNPSKIQNVRLIIRIEDIGIQQVKHSTKLQSSPQTINFQSISHHTNNEYPTDVRPTPELNKRLEELEKQEQRLQKQRQQAFGNSTRNLQSKSSSLTLGKIMLFLLLIFVGFAANKLIRKQRIKLQQTVIQIPKVQEKHHQVIQEQAKVVFVPQANQYKVQIKPHKRGVAKDYSIKIGKDGIPKITEL